MAVNVTVLDEFDGVIESFDVSDYPSSEALSQHLMSLHLNKVEIASDEQVTYTGMMEPGKVQALARLLNNKKQDKAWFTACASMKCGTFKPEKDYVEVLLYAKTKTVTPPARTGHEDSLRDNVDEGQEEERSEVSDEEEDDEPRAKRTRVEEDEEKDDDGIFDKKRGRRASDNAPKNKGISKGLDQGQKKSLKKGQVQGKEDAQEEGEEEGQEKDEEEGKEKGKGKGKKKEGKEVNDSKAFKCVMSESGKAWVNALRNKRRTVSEWCKNNPNKLCSSQIAKETEAYKKYVILRWTKGINLVPPEWGVEYKRGRDFWQARVAADQPSDEAAAPSLTVPPVMVEQLQTMLGSMAPGFMKAYGVQEATVMTSIQGVLDTKLHKFQALLTELMEGVHKDLEAKTSVGQQQDLDPGHQAGEPQQFGAEHSRRLRPEVAYVISSREAYCR
ncbi:hypothetical protein V8C86DRAFT_3120497 [Haematococcus lacustris]